MRNPRTAAKESEVMFNKIITAMFLLLLSGCGSGGTTSYYDNKMAEFGYSPAVGRKMVVGDSITCLWVLPNGYVNRGIIGDTTSGVVLRIGYHVAEKPAEIYLFVGTNDLALSNKATALANYDQIIDRIQSAGIKIKIISLLPRSGGYNVVDFNDGLQEMATAHGIPYLDWYSKFDLSLTYDGLHPTAAGYEVLSRLIVEEGDLR